MTEAEACEQRKHEAILEALADDRVQDEESFRTAVRAYEKRDDQLQQRQRRSFMCRMEPRRIGLLILVETEMIKRNGNPYFLLFLLLGAKESLRQLRGLSSE